MSSSSWVRTKTWRDSEYRFTAEQGDWKAELGTALDTGNGMLNFLTISYRGQSLEVTQEFLAGAADDCPTEQALDMIEDFFTLVDVLRSVK